MTKTAILRLVIATCLVIGLPASLHILLRTDRCARAMPADETMNDHPETVFVHPPTEDQTRVWYLNLAGTDPVRRTAVLRWLEVDGVDAIITHLENHFTILRFFETDVKPEDIQVLNHFPEISSIEFVRSRLSDEAYDALAEVKHVLSVQIEECSEVDNRICRAIATCPSLKRARLDGCRIDDEGVRSLVGLENLAEIGLNDTLITSNTCRHLARMKRLAAVAVQNTAVDDQGMSFLADHNSFTGLALTGTKITDAGLKTVGGFSKLESLSVASTKITDDGFKQLHDLKRLVFLDASHTALGDKSVEVIANFTELYRLYLQGSRITANGLTHIHRLKTLYELNLRDCPIDDAAVLALEQATWVDRLDLRGTSISKAGVKRIRAALKPHATLYNDHGVR